MCQVCIDVCTTAVYTRTLCISLEQDKHKLSMVSAEDLTLEEMQRGSDQSDIVCLVLNLR